MRAADDVKEELVELEGACKGGAGAFGGVRGCRAAVDLVLAVVADARVDNGRLGRLEVGNGRVAGFRRGMEAASMRWHGVSLDRHAHTFAAA